MSTINPVITHAPANFERQGHPWATIFKGVEGEEHTVKYRGRVEGEVANIAFYKVEIIGWGTPDRLDPTRFTVALTGAEIIDPSKPDTYYNQREVNKALYYKEEILTFLRDLVAKHSFHPVEKGVLNGIIEEVSALRE